MPRPKGTASRPALERFLDEASWLVSHAQALADYGRHEEAAAELAWAANAEEQVACLLEASGQDNEAAIHRVSAATCQNKLRQFSRAVTLLRAALSAPLSEEYHAWVEQQRARCLAGARRQWRGTRKRTTSKRLSAMS
jgi:hypothetical protein